MLRRPAPRAAAAARVLAVVVLALLLVSPLGPRTPSARAAEEGADPLVVTIDTLTPGVVPTSGPIRVSGTVTNRDDQTWTTVNLYSVIGDAPMTTAAELAEALDLPADAQVGERIADPEASDTIPEIAPGDTVPFSFEVPRGLLEISAPGVYWFGVQALGQGPDGRDLSADGRDRTFLPLVDQAGRLPLSVVVPLRRQISYAADGSLTGLEGWADVLGEGGRLRSLVDLGLSAGSGAVTYVVDPALVDAAEQLAAGNPARSLAPTIDADGAPVTSPPAPSGAAPSDPSGGSDSSEGAGASGSPAGGASGGSGTAPDAETAAAQAAAGDWLERLGRALPDHEVLALPYGDLDVAAAGAEDPQLYAAARKRSGDVLAPFGVATTPVVASPGGYLDEAVLAVTDPDDTVVITDAMFAGVDGSDESDDTGDTETGAETADLAPTVATESGRRILVSTTAATTGPGPGGARSALSLRQSTLAQAAVRLVAADGDGADADAAQPAAQPLAVVLPNDWNPTSASGFFSGLDVSWLDLRPLTALAAAAPAPTPITLGELRYPRSQERTELGADSFEAARSLSRAGDQLQVLLTRNDAVARTVRDQALTTLGYAVRSRPTAAQLSAASSERWIQARLGAVHIDAPGTVTMTGTSGRFSTTVVNDLPEPVTVGVAARATSSGIEVGRPVSIDVAASSSTRVLMSADAPDGGIHSVTLGLTDARGTPLGDTDQLTIRSLQVSGVIWVFFVAAGALLFGAVAIRLFRRVRAALGHARPSPAP